MDKEKIKKIFNKFIDELDETELQEDNLAEELSKNLLEIKSSLAEIVDESTKCLRKKVFMCINGKIAEEKFQEYKNMMSNDYDVYPVSDYDYNIFSYCIGLDFELIDNCDELWLFYDTEITERMIEEVQHAYDKGIKIRFATKDGV